MKVISTTHFPKLPLFRRGKVRDVYDLGDALLIVATDRISAFDVIMPNPIPRKGEVLNQISTFWFNKTKFLHPNHLITANVDEFPSQCREYSGDLALRSMVVRKTTPLPIECIVRGYLAGSGWTEYKNSRSICGVALPAGLGESERLAEPVFTPSTKAEAGHDQNITFAETEALIGTELAQQIREIAIGLYTYAHDAAVKKGIIIADTKMEFGIWEGQPIVIDELLTPDSSRFWPLDQYAIGSSPPSYDKQFLRNYLLSIGWPKTPPAPELPDEIVQKTSEKYLESLKLFSE